MRDVCQWNSFWPAGEAVNHAETVAKLLVNWHDYYVQVNMVKPRVRETHLDYPNLNSSRRNIIFKSLLPFRFYLGNILKAILKA